MDKVVDHLLVFKGEGVIKDFPGNYTQYREWSKLQPQSAVVAKQEKPITAQKKHSNTQPENCPRRASFKEKREFEQLTIEIDKLNKEKADIETALSSGTISVDEITEMSKRLPVIINELDEKEMRWLELSELKM